MNGDDDDNDDDDAESLSARDQSFPLLAVQHSFTTTTNAMETPTSSAGDLSSLCKQDRLDEALRAAECVYLQGLPLSKDIFYTLLQACSRMKDLAAGREVLSLMVKCRLEASPFLGYHLICLFASCGNLVEAFRIFTMISRPNVHTFHAIILACVKVGESKRALELYDKMQEVPG